MSISAAISELAARDPDAVAVRLLDDPASGPGARPATGPGDAVRRPATVTRRGLDRAATRMARLLDARLAGGVVIDDRIVVAVDNTIGSVVALVAVWRLGATPVVVDAALDADECDRVSASARPVLVVDPTDPELVAAAEQAEQAEPLPDRVASSWKAVTTGGSTGPPRVVLSTGAASADPDRAVAPYLPPGQVQLVAGRLADSAPFTYALRGLMTGHELVVLPRFDPGALLAAVAAHRVTWTVLAPSTMHRIARHPAFATADLSSLAMLVHLGAPCPPALKRTWLERLGPEHVVEVYASSESAGIAMIRGDEWLEHPGSVGRGVGGSEFRVLAPDGTEAPAGEVGEVVMTRPGGPRYRYLGAEPRPAPDGWTALGDLGWLDDDGWLYLVDRVDDAFAVDGATVYPARVEAVLETHPAVRSAAVVPGPDGRPAALLDLGRDDGDGVGSRDAEAVAPDDVLAALADRFRHAETPASASAVDGPLRDEAGKVNRKGLRHDLR